MIARMFGSRTAPPSPTAQRSTPALAATELPRRRAWPLVLGGLVIAAGAAIGAVAVTRATRHHHTRTHDAAVVAVVPPDAVPPPPPIDAAENHDVRDMLKDLADDQEYDAILRLAARATGDAEAEAIVADARAKYVAAQLAAIDGENKIAPARRRRSSPTTQPSSCPTSPRSPPPRRSARSASTSRPRPRSRC